MQKKISYPLIVADLSQTQQNYHLQANKEQCLYLAEVLQLPSVLEFQADMLLKNKYTENTLIIQGHIIAVVELESVVSLEKFNKKYDFDFSLCYDTKATYASQQEAREDWRADVPDIIEDGKIDLVDIAIEQIAIRLDDYPRLPGEVFNFTPEFDENEKIKENPFTMLEKLKK